MKTVASILLLSAFGLGAQASPSPDFVRMRYGTVGVQTDLALGLWSWPMPMDYDGDGDLDLVVSTPCCPSRGTWLFENRGKGVFAAARKVDETGLGNVAVSWVGGRPVVVSTGCAYWNFAQERWANGRPLEPLPWNVHDRSPRLNVWRLVDFNGDGLLDVVVGVEDWNDQHWSETSGRIEGAIHGYVYVALGTPDGKYGTPERVKTTDGKPIDTFGSPSPMLLDLDGDGDLDLVCGSFKGDFSFFRNLGTRHKPSYAPGEPLIAADGHPLHMPVCIVTPSLVDWDGDGDEDIVCGNEDGRVALMENREGRFAQPVYFRQDAAEIKFGSLVTPFAVDYDEDGRIDLLCGNSAGEVAVVRNLGGGKWALPELLPVKVVAGPQGSVQGECESEYGYTAPVMYDRDGDGLKDLVVASITGEILFCRNVGKSGKSAFARPELLFKTLWRTRPYPFDWNGDGKPELTYMDAEGFLATEREGRIFFWKDGRPMNVNRTNWGFGNGVLGRRKFCICDWDGDGLPDILIDGRVNVEFLRQVRSEGGRHHFESRGEVARRQLVAHDTCPDVADLDGDGKPELIVGAEDGCIYLLPHWLRIQPTPLSLCRCASVLTIKQGWRNTPAPLRLNSAIPHS